ncbi:cytochrome c551 [Bacillus fonticola]|uniref:cytochrome c551 n=1 Tax=Bacillus fonticola TaxID=2728853 RepID=UPI0014730A27|nr:cytochrome c [Bacillus fonticola]
MNKRLWLLTFGALLTVTACGGVEEAGNGDATVESSAPKEVANAAEEVYGGNCIQCHGENLAGVSGPNLQKVGGKYSEDEIRNIIENGRGGMPPGLIEGGDLDNVVQWLAGMK